MWEYYQCLSDFFQNILIFKLEINIFILKYLQFSYYLAQKLSKCRILLNYINGLENNYLMKEYTIFFRIDIIIYQHEIIINIDIEYK